MDENKLSYDNLIRLSRSAIDDYETLLQQYNALVDENSENRQNLEKLYKVLEPMLDEYGELKSKYDVEKGLRQAAETYASRVVKDNLKMKRQSAMLIQQISAHSVPIDFESIGDIDNDNQGDSQVDHLNQTIADLKRQLTDARMDMKHLQDTKDILSAKYESSEKEVQRLKDDFEAVKVVLEKERQTSQSQARELKNLKRASGLAYGDFQAIKDRCDAEKQLRMKAESALSELKAQYALAGQSDCTVDEQITKMVEENEALKNKVQELESKLEEDISSPDSVLEQKLEVISEELERVTDDLVHVKEERDDLAAKVIKLEKEKKEFLAVPVPPPPPPPPGPPAGIFKSLTDVIKDNKRKKEDKIKKVVGDRPEVKNDAMASAMKEMMERIQKGPVLKPVDMNTRPVDMKPSKEGEAMEELHNLLVGFKSKGRIHQTEVVKKLSPEEEELAKKLAARKNKIDEENVKAENGTIISEAKSTAADNDC